MSSQDSLSSFGRDIIVLGTKYSTPSPKSLSCDSFDPDTLAYMEHFREWLERTLDIKRNGGDAIEWRLDAMDRYYNETHIPRPSQLEQEYQKERKRRAHDKDLMVYLRGLPDGTDREKYDMYRTYMGETYPPHIKPMSMPEFRTELGRSQKLG
jgi:hypothetical protein